MAELVTKVEGLIPGADRDTVERRGAEEPEWLRNGRLRAWKVYEETPLPTTRLEEWRYTEVRQLALEQVRAADATGAAPAADPPADLPERARRLVSRERLAAGRVLQVGADIVSVELDPGMAERGVILTDLRTAAREHPELVEPWLGRILTPEHGKFQALNAAMWSAGVFLYVPRGVHVPAPIRVGRWIGEGGVAVFPRTLIVAEEASQVAYVDEYASPDVDQPVFVCAGVEVVASDSAQVQHVGLQQWGAGVRHLSLQRTVAKRDAKLDTLVVNLGATVARVDNAASLEGPGSRSDMLGLSFAQGDQHFDHNTRQDHVSDHASSDLLYKSALYDKGRSVFRGIIKVFKGAQRTDAYQTNRNLLLSDKARADSLPNLEIEADDVRCSHGATVGHLDEEELFYLMSRGLSRSEAERLVVFGFFGEVLERLSLPTVVEELRLAIEAKITGHQRHG
ncbi:MAG TPA: Fe-S cluster assembly protein SufD [Longimicrobiales bacterium]|nr:Fe-S cluster assembly protein SufD [Longimicrobiales bacterium]